MFLEILLVEIVPIYSENRRISWCCDHIFGEVKGIINFLLCKCSLLILTLFQGVKSIEALVHGVKKMVWTSSKIWSQDSDILMFAYKVS